MIRIVPGLVAIGLLAGCPQGPDTGDGDTDNTVVYEGPVLVHTPIDTVEAGTVVPLSVQATDDDGVGGVRLYFRTLGEAAWDVAELTEATEGTWTGEVPASAVAAPGLQYYFRGQDLSDLQIASYLPQDGQLGPFVVPIPLRGLPVPYVEDFEGLATTSLYDLGWDEEVEGFGGYPWQSNSTRSASGAHAVAHRRGVEGIAALDDWLISPPLDLTGLPELQVTWQEWGNHTALATHSVWISTTSPDPDDGGFTKIADVPAPIEDTFGRSVLIDLTPYTSEALAWVAWRYEGQFADDWWIDDVAFEALGPDIRLDDWASLPAEPGAQTTVTFTIANTSPKPSGAFTVSASTDAANGVFSDPTDEGLIDGLAADGTVEVALLLDVDAAFPDDSMLPFTLSIDEGGEIRTWELELVVGTLPAATIDVTTTALGLVQGWLGRGDPSDPDLEFAAFSEVVNGSRSFQVDLASHTAHLPPGPGEDRWYLRLSPSSAGSLTGFEITFDDTLYTSDDLGAWVAGAQEIYYLPRPPAPAVTVSTTTPTPVKPGDAVTWNVTLVNQGAATIGLTTALVTTDDPDVTVNTTTPTELAAAGWAAGASSSFAVSFAVAATQVDSQPIRLTVTVTDEIESFTADATVAVPWPVLHVTGVSFDDDAPGGDGDGLFEPGERTKVLVEVTNQGGKDALVVSCTLSQTGGAPTATLHDAVESYQGLTIASPTAVRPYDLSVSGGALGDTLEMHLACTSNSPAASYGSDFEIVLGEAPWITVSAIDDPLGDALGGDIDLVNGRYRSDGTTLEIVFESGTPFAPATAFFESWMTQQGSEFVLYQLVVLGRASGAPTSTVRGCTLYLSGTCYSWGTVTTPIATVLSPTEMHVAIDLADMGLVVDRIVAGFGGGFCAGQALYCDQLPDGWGTGVTGLLTYRFLPLDVGAD